MERRLPRTIRPVCGRLRESGPAPLSQAKRPGLRRRGRSPALQPCGRLATLRYGESTGGDRYTDPLFWSKVNIHNTLPKLGAVAQALLKHVDGEIAFQAMGSD